MSLWGRFWDIGGDAFTVRTDAGEKKGKTASVPAVGLDSLEFEILSDAEKIEVLQKANKELRAVTSQLDKKLTATRSLLDSSRKEEEALEDAVTRLQGWNSTLTVIAAAGWATALLLALRQAASRS